MNSSPPSPPHTSPFASPAMVDTAAAANKAAAAYKNDDSVTASPPSNCPPVTTAETQVTPSPPPKARTGASILEVSSAIQSYKTDNNEGESEMEMKAVGTSNVSEGYMNRRRLIINDFLDFLKAECKKDSNLLTLVSVPPSFPTNHVLIENVWVCFSGGENKREKVRELNTLLINWVGNRRLKTSKNKQLHSIHYF